MVVEILTESMYGSVVIVVKERNRKGLQASKFTGKSITENSSKSGGVTKQVELREMTILQTIKNDQFWANRAFR